MKKQKQKNKEIWKIELRMLNGQTLYTDENYPNKREAMDDAKGIRDSYEIIWIEDNNGFVRHEHISAVIVVPWAYTIMAQEQLQRQFQAEVMKGITGKQNMPTQPNIIKPSYMG